MPKSFDNEAYCSVDFIEFNELKKIVEERYPYDKKNQIKYAKEIMSGQLYIFYLAEILQRITIDCAYGLEDRNRKETVQFSTEAVETLLRAMLFMINHMHDGLPKHNYDYIISKSSTFLNELFEQVVE